MYRSPDQRDKNDKLGEAAPSTRRGPGLPIRGRCGTSPLSWRINALGAAIASVTGFHCSVVTLFLSEPRLLVRSTAAFGLIALRLIFPPLLRLPRLIISPLLVLPLLIAPMLLFASHPRIIFIERFRQHAPPPTTQSIANGPYGRGSVRSTACLRCPLLPNQRFWNGRNGRAGSAETKALRRSDSDRLLECPSVSVRGSRRAVPDGPGV